MKRSPQDIATLERIAQPGYTFSLQPPWPYGFEPQPYTPPRPISGLFASSKQAAGWGRSIVSATHLQKIEG